MPFAGQLEYSVKPSKVLSLINGRNRSVEWLLLKTD